VKPEADWPRGVAPVRVGVDCQGTEHTVLWRRGALVLADHDPGADEVLVALGGDRPPCLDVQRSWRLGYIEQDPPVASAALVRSLSSLARWMSGGGDHPAVLPEQLRRLREASVLHTWGRGLREPTASDEAQRAFLERSITRRVRDLLVRQLRPLGAERDAALDVAIGDHAEAEGRCEGTQAWARVRVPVGWLTGVWVSGLETWQGDVVLDAADRRPTSLDVVRWVPEAGGYDLVVTRSSPR
jgi:hypothetical protein